MERFIENTMYASRWLLAPIYLGLSLGLLILALKFFQEIITITSKPPTSAMSINDSSSRMTSASNMVNTLLAILDAHPAPSLDGKPVAYSQLNLLGAQVSEVLIIGASARKPLPGVVTLIDVFLPAAELLKPQVGDSRIIVWIPGDPRNPVREYASLKAFTAQLALNLRSVDYQRFFTGF